MNKFNETLLSLIGLLLVGCAPNTPVITSTPTPIPIPATISSASPTPTPVLTLSYRGVPDSNIVLPYDRSSNKQIEVTDTETGERRYIKFLLTPLPVYWGCLKTAMDDYAEKMGIRIVYALTDENDLLGFATFPEQLDRHEKRLITISQKCRRDA